MRCRVPILLCALLLICVAGFGALPAAGQPQTEGTHLEAQLYGDGDAEWTVSVYLPITDDEERAEFEDFAERFEAGTDDLDLGTDAFERAAAESSAATGREMAITSVTRESELINETGDGETFTEYGALRVSFTWESFARVGENNTLYVDDAFNATDGTWLPGLGADQSLTIKAPPEYGAPTTSPIGAEEGDLHWTGPETFEPGYLRIVYHPGTTTTVEAGNSDMLVIGALALSGTALLVGVYLLIGRRRTPGEPGDDPTVGTASTDVSETTAGSPTSDGETISEPEESDASVEQTDQELALLSDEERVEYLLEQSGGRMKQANIVKETGWSNAKVSQLLSAMDEEDRLDKLRIGRENIISLPGEGIGDLKNEADDDR